MPAAFLFLAEREGRTGRLAGAVGVTFLGDRPPGTGQADWPVASVLDTGAAVVVDENGVRRVLDAMGYGVAAPIKAALLLPFGGLGKPGASGVLVVGLAPRLLFDELYRSFLVLVAGHIGTAVASARALEAAQQRAEALAHIDRAKTAFFANVSHRVSHAPHVAPRPDRGRAGLREPDAGRREPGDRAPQWTAAAPARECAVGFLPYRAGRAEAAFIPTDLCALTKDVAAAFRSAVERAGLGFDVDCEPLEEPICIDRDMWEKIVLNLLSNAFKFSFTGSIGVSLRLRSGLATLVIRDTGIGIALAEVPRLFERFHRVEGTRSRSHEGTRIGLALVRDLVRLHGGDVAVESREGEGTIFTVSIPTGTAHRGSSPRPPASLGTRGRACN